MFKHLAPLPRPRQVALAVQRRAARGLWAAGLCLLTGLAQAAAPSVTISRLGFTDDAAPALHGPALYLKGDGPPELDSFENFTQRIADNPLDVVVLGASFANYEGECLRLNSLPTVNSCTTVVIRDADDADDPEVVSALQQAEVVYFRGGDQCNFMRWQGSATVREVQALVERGGGTGGGSAGLAIQGGLAVFDGCRGSISSRLALAEPYQPGVSFSDRLFDWAPLADLLTDSHFVRRDRMGRLMTFLCRQVAGGRSASAWGLGLNDGGVLLIDRDGRGTVFGDTAYLVQADQPAAGCQNEAEPVTYSGFKIWRVEAGGSIDLTQRPHDGYYLVDVVQGQMTADPYNLPAAVASRVTVGRTADRQSGF